MPHGQTSDGARVKEEEEEWEEEKIIADDSIAKSWRRIKIMSFVQASGRRDIDTYNSILEPVKMSILYFSAALFSFSLRFVNGKSRILTIPLSVQYVYASMTVNE